MNKNTTAVIFSLIVIFVIGGVVFAVRQTAVESKTLEPFAQCIEESGAKFYGAFWCPHCNQQKALFGRAHRALPYVECSTPDGNNQTEICATENIESYPTWKFTDGTTSNGVTSLAVLAEKTGCVIPVEGEETPVDTNNLEAQTTEIEATSVATPQEVEVSLTEEPQIEGFTPELE